MMDYPPDYTRAQWAAPFPSPVSPAPFLFPQQTPQTSSQDPRPATLPLNLNGLSAASPQSLSPVAPHQPQPAQLHPHQLHAHHAHPHQPHHVHSHSLSSGSSISPITPVSPQSMPLLCPQPQFPYNFDDPSPGLAPDPVLSQRRSTGSLSASASELAVQKSVPRKRSLTSTLPVSPSAASAPHSIHQHSHSHSYSSSQTGHPTQHALPHIITTNASSPPPPTSPASSPSSHPSHSHSRSLSHSLSHSSLSQTHPQLEINTNPTSPYDDIDSAGPGYAGLGGDVSDDDFGSPSAPSFSPSGTSGNPNVKPSGPSAQQAQTVLARSVGTNNFVTKLYHMINEAKAQHFITWTDLGTSFVVSNVGEFSRNILGSHFKHNNFSSFVRQLNMYGFHKINRTPRAQRTSSSSQTWEFSHPKFLRDRPDLLEAIKRKALEPDPREKNRVELPGEVARVLAELREENRALWREVRSLSGRVPQQGSASANLPSQGSHTSVGLGSGHVLTHSRSSSNLGGDDGERDDWEDEDGVNASAGCGPMSGVSAGGSQGTEEWDSQGSRFNFWQGSGLNTPNLPFNFGVPPAGEEWKRWVENEIVKEKKRVERLVGVVKALVDVSGRAGVNVSQLNMNREPDGIPPSILQELHELSLTFDGSPSPSMPIPSPSPSPSPHPACHQHSPNIFITSPTSPSPYPSSHAHSRSPSRDSDTHSNPNAHTALPMLSIPNSAGAGPSQFTHHMHTPSSSPTASDFGFGQASTGICHRLGSGLIMRQQPNITLTLETDDGEGRVEKRARMEGDKISQVIDASLAGIPQETGLCGEEMDIVPIDAVEDVKLPSPTTGAGVSINIGGNKVVGLRSRSDSAPMWGGAVGGETSPVQGGLSANWTGRGRSGSSFGQ